MNGGGNGGGGRVVVVVGIWIWKVGVGAQEIWWDVMGGLGGVGWWMVVDWW